MEKIHNIRINVDFGRDFANTNQPLQNSLKYRLGPIFYTGIASLDSDNFLDSNSSLQVKWTAVPVVEFRLIRTITQTVLFYF